MFVLLLIAFVVLAVLFMPKPPAPKANDAETIDVPEAEEGRELGIPYGTVWLKKPQVHWYGDQYAKPIYSKSGGKK